MTQLEKDIIQLCRENKLYQPFQVGGFIISPIHWGEVDGEVEVDCESMMEEFEQTLDVLDLTYFDAE